MLPNRDLDSGQATRAGEYSLTDETYARLLGQLSSGKFVQMTPELRINILDFYSDLSALNETKKNSDEWEKVLTELGELKTMTPKPSGGPS